MNWALWYPVRQKCKQKKSTISCLIIPKLTWFVCWLSDMILSLTSSWVGFNPSFKHPTCLATLKSCDTTKQSVCGWQYVYIHIHTHTHTYIYIYIYATLTYIYIYIHTHIYIYIKKHKQTHLYAYIYIYIYTRTNFSQCTNRTHNFYIIFSKIHKFKKTNTGIMFKHIFTQKLLFIALKQLQTMLWIINMFLINWAPTLNTAFSLTTVHAKWWIHCLLISSIHLLSHATSLYNWTKQICGVFGVFQDNRWIWAT